MAALGSNTACPTSNPGSALNTFSPGCFANDMVFENFTVTDVATSGDLTQPSTGNVDAFATGSPGDTTLNFDSSTWSVSSLSDQVDSRIQFDVTGTNIDSIATSGLAFTFSSPGAVLQITLNACPGTTTFTSGCSGGVSSQYTLFNDGVTTNTSPATFGPTNQVAIQEEILIQGGYTVTNLPNEFGEAVPEPSTLVLLGGAFAGLAALRLRRRKHSSPA